MDLLLVVWHPSQLSTIRPQMWPLLFCYNAVLVLAQETQQSIIVVEDIPAFAVLNPNQPFRNSSQRFEPSGNTSLVFPYFQVYNEEFFEILGPDPAIRVIVENDTFPFAHDGCVWIPDADEVFFSGGRTVGRPVCHFSPLPV